MASKTPSRNLRKSIFLAIGFLFPIAAQAIVTATPPPGGYTKPATSAQNGTSTTTNFSTTSGSGSAGATSGSGSGGSSGSSSSPSFNTGQKPLIAGTGGYVAGYCYSVGGDIANISNLQTYQSNLIATIQSVGKALNTGQMQQMSAAVQQLNQKLQEQSLSLKKLSAAKAKENYLNQTTGINALTNNCTWQSGATNTLAGIASAQQITAAAYSGATQAEKPVTNPLDSVKALANATAPAISAATILPLGGNAIAPTASAISAYIKNAVVPFNAPSVPATMKNPAAANFNAVDNIMKTQASLATTTLAAIARHNVPTIQDTLANHLWKEGGNSGTPPGEANGKISQDGLLQSITDGRYASSTFYRDIQGHGDTWQIKQQAIMLAAQLRMQEEQETMLEHAVAIQAALLASEESGRVNALNTERANAIAQSNGAMAGAN